MPPAAATRSIRRLDYLASSHTTSTRVFARMSLANRLDLPPRQIPTMPWRLAVSRFVYSLILALYLASFGPSLAFAQESPSSPFENESYRIRIGFDGHLRLGRWCPLMVKTLDGRPAELFSATMLDGDGIPIHYEGKLSQDVATPNVTWGWIRLGRKVSSIQLKIYGSGDDVRQIVPMTVPVKRDKILRSTQKILLAIGSEEITTQAFASTLTGQGENRQGEVIFLSTPEQLPPNRTSLDCVDTIMLVGSPKLADELTDAQSQAILDWVEGGGRFIVSIPGDAGSLYAKGTVLGRFVPGNLVASTTLEDTGVIESLVNSRNPLTPQQPIAVGRLNAVDGKIQVAQRDLPLTIRSARGLGEIVFVPFDLNHPGLLEWTSLGNFLLKLRIPTEGPSESTGPSAKRAGSAKHFGYTDLTGQLRVPLDQFSQVQFVSFTFIAVLIALYILLIGPVDYYLLNNLIGKMELTWITFPLYSILFCFAAWMISQWTRPSEIQINQLEIVDIDIATGQAQGKIWSNLYSPTGTQLDVALAPENALGFDYDDSIVSWNGLPGDGLGGMMTRPGGSNRDESYQQMLSVNADGQMQASLKKLPAQVSSSRSIFANWSGKIPFQSQERLRYRPDLDRVTGTIRNPFNARLNNCRLLYGVWAYELDEPLEVGDAFDIQVDTHERNIRGHLTQKKTKAGKEKDYSVRSNWDPAETRMNRIANMLMFHEAAGGVAYTGLSHDYFPALDMSRHLDLNRAILIGELDAPSAKFMLDGGATIGEMDKTTTIVRIIFTVDPGTQTP